MKLNKMLIELSSQRILAYFFLLVFSASNLGCQTYFYKARTQNIERNTPSEVLNKNLNSNFYVLHVGSSIWEIKNIEVFDGKLTGTLAPFDSTANLYYKQYKNGDSKVKHNKLNYIYQVHIYARQFTKSEETITIVDDDIDFIDVYDQNIGKIIAFHVGLPILALAASLTIFLLIACNCPHTYIYDGETYYFNNTLFTGATSPVIERHDYKLMPDYFAHSDTYDLLIKNEENEKQFTNQLELIVIEHDKSIQVLSDQNGNIYSISNPISPIIAVDNSQVDLKNKINYDDDLGFQFNTESDEDFSTVIASFSKPEDVSNAKLILKAKNSQWAAYVYKEFSKLFGRYYDNWVKKNHKKTKEEVMANLKAAGIPLVVSIKKDNVWIELDVIDLIGDVNYNSLVIPINEDLLTDENIEIRIQSGFWFWDLDYLAMDFSAPVELKMNHLNPNVALTNGTIDNISALSADDEIYMENLVKGDSTVIKFSGLPISSTKTRTIILHSKGYYIPQDEYTGKPDRDELSNFKSEGEMSRFSKKLYDEILEKYSLKK